MTDASMNTGTKAVGFTLMGSELVAMISDAKWLLVVIMACAIVSIIIYNLMLYAFSREASAYN